MVAQNQEDLLAAIKWAKENSLPYFILGGGSNLLVTDEGFEGLVIKFQSSNFKVQNFGDELKITCDAGVALGKVILETIKLGYSGVEWGFGIPGTVGGAICGNAGRLGQDISQVVEKVWVLGADLERRELSRGECEFNYRESRFKKTGEIILKAEMVFEKKEKAQIDELLNQAKNVIKKSPPFPSAGCVFKNYVVGESDFLLKKHPELKERTRGNKIGVGYLIEQCGLRGKQIGGAKIWEGHANYIVNTDDAKASDVMSLIELCKNSVKEKYGIELVEEIRRVGF